MVVKPGLQVAGLYEIEQVFRQLLQLLQGQVGEALPVSLMEAPETAAELANGQGSGFLLPARFQSLMPSLLQAHPVRLRQEAPQGWRGPQKLKQPL
jgi:hypothetical protein